MSDKKELVATHGSAPSTIISQALTSGADLEKLQGLLDLQERWEANEARKSYMVAMAAFKAEPPEIEKDKTVDFKTTKGRTLYSHASLANVASKINTSLSKHGLSAAWKTGQENGVSVTCTITHELGHSESTTLTAAPDNSGNKNSIQAIGSTVTYLQRYTILALTGLATHEPDDDGGGAACAGNDGQKTITAAEFNEKQLEIDQCTNKTRLDKWIANHKTWLDRLSEDQRDRFRSHCKQYYDMFKEKEN